MRWVVPVLAGLPMLVPACTGGTTELERGPPTTASTATGASPTVATLEESVGAIDDPHVAVDGDGTVHLIWWDDSAPEGAVRHAVVEGAAIGPPETISDAMDVFTSETSVLIDPAGQVCAFFDGWLDEQDLSSRGLYLRCLSGNAWSAPGFVTSEGVTSTFDPAFDASGSPIAVATTPISSVTFQGQELSESDLATAQAQLVVDVEGSDHVLWAELGDGEFALLHRTSNDAGTTWSSIEALEGTEFFVPEPELIAAADGSVHVFYETSRLFHRVWTSESGWGPVVAGPECSGDYAFALSPTSEPVAACGGLDGVSLTTESDGSWIPLAPVESSVGVATASIALVVEPDGTRHVAWVTATSPPELHYAAIPG